MFLGSLTEHCGLHLFLSQGTHKENLKTPLPPGRVHHAEFSSQLPHDGGAFYTSDTVESARPHYREAWPPILHAASLWLCEGGGFEGALHQEAPQGALGPGGLRGGPAFLQLSRGAHSRSPEQINKDWFYLLFGTSARFFGKGSLLRIWLILEVLIAAVQALSLRT